MKFIELQKLYDNEALLEYEGKIYRFCERAEDIAKCMPTKLFEDVETGEIIEIETKHLASGTEFKVII